MCIRDRSVRFTPADTANYNSVTSSISIVVNLAAPAGLSYTSSSLTGTVGTAISNLNPAVTGTGITYSISPALPTGLVFNTATGVISGTPTAAATSQVYTITATNSGGSTTAQVTIMVNKVTPVLTWSPSPTAGLTYPAPLSSTQLNATSSVAGTFSYNPTNGSVLNAGTNTLVATFSPTDTNSYTSGITITNKVVVAKGTNNIIFGALPIKYVDEAAFNLAATASSGLTVTYSSSNTNVAAVLGSLVTIMGEGTTTITASQAGDNNWSAATTVSQTLVVQTAIKRGLIAYLPFDGNPEDVTGSGFNGTLQGAVLTADRFGAGNKAYYFAGNNEHITLNRTLPDTQELTFVAWIRPDDQRYAPIFYDAAYFTPGRDTEIAINTGGRLQATFTKVSDPGPDSIITGQVWQTGQWVQLAFVIRQNGTFVFLNGVKVGLSSTVSHNIGYHSAPFLGAANHGFQVEYGFKGAMDDVRFYSRGLTDAEIDQLYSAEAPPFSETFGSGSNQFSIDFVRIGNPGNAADTTGSPNPAGSVAYNLSLIHI